MKKVFLIDESIVDFLCDLWADIDPYSLDGFDPMYLLLAISDYCIYGEVRESVKDEPRLQPLLNLLKDKLDFYMETLREKGIIDEEG